MKMKGGNWGKVLKVNLTDGSSEEVNYTMIFLGEADLPPSGFLITKDGRQILYLPKIRL